MYDTKRTRMNAVGAAYKHGYNIPLLIVKANLMSLPVPSLEGEENITAIKVAQCNPYPTYQTQHARYSGYSMPGTVGTAYLAQWAQYTYHSGYSRPGTVGTAHPAQ